jgi:hypothetical protein
MKGGRVNRGNGTDPLTVGRGKCPQTQWGKTVAKRERDRYTEMSAE